MNHNARLIILHFTKIKDAAIVVHTLSRPWGRRSFLVHLGAVERMTYTTVTLRSGAALPLGRTYVKTLREALAAWREGE